MLAKTLTTPTRTADVSGDLDHPGVSVDPSLEERLRREILQSERTRMLILAGLSGSLLVVFPALVLVFETSSCTDVAWRSGFDASSLRRKQFAKCLTMDQCRCLRPLARNRAAIAS
jgi:hypothetical protein